MVGRPTIIATDVQHDERSPVMKDNSIFSNRLTDEQRKEAIQEVISLEETLLFVQTMEEPLNKMKEVLLDTTVPESDKRERIYEITGPEGLGWFSEDDLR